MRDVTAQTAAAGFEYQITYREFESLSEILDTVDGGEETVVAIVNSAQRQNALQGDKGDVREAVEEHGGDSAEAQEAIEAHRESAYGYVIGRPRGRSSGVTKTAARKFGEKLREQLGEEELQEMAEEMGIEL